MMRRVYTLLNRLPWPYQTILILVGVACLLAAVCNLVSAVCLLLMVLLRLLLACWFGRCRWRLMPSRGRKRAKKRRHFRHSCIPREAVWFFGCFLDHDDLFLKIVYSIDSYIYCSSRYCESVILNIPVSPLSPASKSLQPETPDLKRFAANKRFWQKCDPLYQRAHRQKDQIHHAQQMERQCATILPGTGTRTHRNPKTHTHPIPPTQRHRHRHRKRESPIFSRLAQPPVVGVMSKWM